MKILAVDVGTGTQDILLFDSNLDIENAYKLVLPAPTMIIRRKLQAATRAGQAVLLTGVTMGGGPNSWAAEDHIRAGLPIYATPDAARSFNDELDKVEAMGVRVISEDEEKRLPADVVRLELRDFDLSAIRAALDEFGVGLEELAAIAVAVFDHGAAPPGVSDRQFRFDYLDERIGSANRPLDQRCLDAFAFRAGEIPPIMTRLRAVAKSAGDLPVPLVVMDTAPAAVLGATFDSHVSTLERAVIANIGNFHTLAFRLRRHDEKGFGIEGVFEHHTGLLTAEKLEGLIRTLADGSLRHADVFNDNGHGALIYTGQPLILNPEMGSLVVTGPRRNLLRSSPLHPYFAVPFGDMMIAGCFGLLAATAERLPELREPILRALYSPTGIGRPPWEE